MGAHRAGHCPDLEDGVGRSDHCPGQGFPVHQPAHAHALHTCTARIAVLHVSLAYHTCHRAWVGKSEQPTSSSPLSQSTLGGSKGLDDGQYLQADTCTCVATHVMSHDPYQPAPNCALEGAKQRRRLGLWAGLGWLLEGRGPLAGSCSPGPPAEPHWAGDPGRGKKHWLPLAGR